MTLLLLQVAVGVTGEIRDLVLPGPEIVARPVEDYRSPIVLRIDAVYAHGTAHRYDLVFYGTVPGDFDLRDYLVRADGSAMDGVPPIPVRVVPAYPVTERRRVAPVETPPRPALGGYRTALIVAGVVWAAGLLAFVRRRRYTIAEAPREPTLADQLRPLVERAVDGTIDAEEKARLERMLLEYWRRRAGLEPAQLRDHPEAGPLLRALEDWFHRPGGGPGEIAELLRPYR